jgi:hypothetical protein
MGQLQLLVDGELRRRVQKSQMMASESQLGLQEVLGPEETQL